MDSIYLRGVSAVRWLRALTGDARGGPLMETIVALSVLTVVGTGVLLGISTIQTSDNSTEGQSVAENLARNEMANFFAQSYQATTSPTYSSITDLPPGYTVAITAESCPTLDPNTGACGGSDSNIHKYVVTVSREGQQVLVLETLRAN